MSNPSWMDHPALKNMEPVKKDVLFDLIKESQGKPMNQCLPIILKAQGRLKAAGMSFTQEETSLLMGLLTSGLSSEDMKKVDAMKNMMNKS